jgi:putative endonuclease
MSLFYAYIIKSLSRNTFYYGSTSDLIKRIEDHNSGRVRFTKGRRPWVIHYFETFETRSAAFRRERLFKSIDGYIFLKNQNII